MSKPPVSERLYLQGTAGRLESIIDRPAEGSPEGAVVVCHPHPQHGGTMHNKVAHSLARSFLRAGFVALRFNFRGTEGSDGEYDAGAGELDDTLTAMSWMRERYPAVPLWLAGFSFGAAIAVRAALSAGASGLVCVAPAVSRFASALEGQPDCPWLIIQGDCDELVDVDDTIAWVNSLEPGPELLIMPAAEHFFHGRLNELREAVVEFVSAFASTGS